MPTYAGVLPMDCLEVDSQIDSEHFRSLIACLNRTQAMTLVARINLFTGEHPVELKKQHQALIALEQDGMIDSRSAQRIAQFVSVHRDSEWFFFSRAHALELFRAIAMWAPEQLPATTEVPNDVFLRAVLMSYELFSRRLEVPSALDTDDIEVHGFEFLRTMREKSLVQPGVTNPLAILGRISLMMEKHFFVPNKHYVQAFEQVAQMTLEDYRDCATLIFAVESTAVAEPLKLKSFADTYDFSLDEISKPFPHKRSALQRFLELESISLESLSNNFAGQSSSDFIDFRSFREKPILALPGGRYIATDNTFLAERATYGPLFFNIGTGTQDKFEVFGDAFELYARDEVSRLAKSWGCSRAPLHGHFALARRKGDSPPEIADLTLTNGDTCVLIQVKGLWPDDRLIRLPASDFWQKIRKSYSASGAGGKRKGIGQLAYAIKGLLEGSLRETPDFVVRHKKIIPLLLVHDCHLVIPYFGYFLARDFWCDFGLDKPPLAGHAEISGCRVFSPVVLSIVELENLQHFADKVNIFDLLEFYSDWDKQRLKDFRELLARIDIEPTEYSNAMKAGRDLIEQMKERFTEFKV